MAIGAVTALTFQPFNTWQTNSSPPELSGTRRGSQSLMPRHSPTVERTQCGVDMPTCRHSVARRIEAESRGSIVHRRIFHPPSFTAVLMQRDCAGWPHECRWKEKSHEVKDGGEKMNKSA